MTYIIHAYVADRLVSTTTIADRSQAINLATKIAGSTGAEVRVTTRDGRFVFAS